MSSYEAAVRQQINQFQHQSGYYGGVTQQVAFGQMSQQSAAAVKTFPTTLRCDSNDQLMSSTKKEEKKMVKEIQNDVRSFMRENKSVIYWMIILYCVDHYLFEGALKARLQKIVQNLVGKVEEKLDRTTV